MGPFESLVEQSLDFDPEDGPAGDEFGEHPAVYLAMSRVNQDYDKMVPHCRLVPDWEKEAAMQKYGPILGPHYIVMMDAERGNVHVPKVARDAYPEITRSEAANMAKESDEVRKRRWAAAPRVFRSDYDWRTRKPPVASSGTPTYYSGDSNPPDDVEW